VRSTALSSLRSKPHVAPFVGPRWYVAAAWLAGAVVLQATIVHAIAIRSVVPSLVLVVVVWYALRVDARRATFYGLIAGACEDALSPGTGASWTLATGAAALAASVMSRGFFADSLPMVAAITLAVTLLRALVFWSVMAISGYPAGLAAMHFHEALVAAILNVALVVAAMLIVRRSPTQQ
jgi:rod shape-determining protein MreD